MTSHEIQPMILHRSLAVARSPGWRLPTEPPAALIDFNARARCETFALTCSIRRAGFCFGVQDEVNIYTVKIPSAYRSEYYFNLICWDIRGLFTQTLGLIPDSRENSEVVNLL